MIVREQGLAEVARQEVEEVMRIHTPEGTDASETESLEGELAGFHTCEVLQSRSDRLMT